MIRQNPVDFPEIFQAKCNCGRVLKARAVMAGKKVRCPTCGTIRRLPGMQMLRSSRAKTLPTESIDQSDTVDGANKTGRQSPQTQSQSDALSRGPLALLLGGFAATLVIGAVAGWAVTTGSETPSAPPVVDNTQPDNKQLDNKQPADQTKNDAGENSKRPDAASVAKPTLRKKTPAEIVSAGGRFWSSPGEEAYRSSQLGNLMVTKNGSPENTFGVVCAGPYGAPENTTITSNRDFFVWPTTDRPFPIQSGKVKLTFEWAMPDGQKVGDGKYLPQGIIAYRRTSSKGMQAATGFGTLDLKTGSSHGTFQVSIDSENMTPRNLLFWVELHPKDGTTKRSNLMSIQTTQRRSTTAAPATPKPEPATARTSDAQGKTVLPGAEGRLFKTVGTSSPIVTGADVAEGISDPKPNSPPARRILRSGIQKLYLAVAFARKPYGARMTADIHNHNGPVPVRSGLMITSYNNATGVFSVKMIRQSASGTFADGPYQARIQLNGKVVALINWTIGKPTN